ncbi:MAG: transporter substrate-binding domain-containing protein [Actinomycetota bacterium]
MRKFRFRGLFALVAVVAMMAAACGEEPSSSTPAPAGSGTDSPAGEPDLLARIQEEGVIRVATDQKYKPQSWYDTKTGEWRGFDVEVAQEIAARLGVEAEIAHQEWDLVTAGSWNDRWDMNVGSMTVTEERDGIFSFTPAYYFTPASVAVHSDNTTITDTSTDLDGMKICVGSSTTYQSFLEQQLNIPGYTFDYVIDDPEIITYATDTDALDNLALGDGARCDAAVTATPTIDQFIADGGTVKIVGDPLYGEPLSVAFDKASPIDNASLVEAVSAIIEEMHADGTLTALSEKWYGEDITQT